MSADAPTLDNPLQESVEASEPPREGSYDEAIQEGERLRRREAGQARSTASTSRAG